MPRDREYIPGSFYRICDRTGFKVREFGTRKQWNNFIVRAESWEDRPSQDFVRGTSETEMKVWKPRPRQVDTHIGPLQTETTAPTPAGGTILHVFSELRLDLGDSITVMLSSGENFTSFVQDVSVPGQVRIYPPLPYAVLAGAVIFSNSAVSGANIG